MTSSPLPMPPLELATRVGGIDDADPMKRYVEIGATLKSVITSGLPSDFEWSGRRALDFGCGAGRVLRHFAREAASAEFSGCDIDAASIGWMRENLSPPFNAFRVEEHPGLPQADAYFDVTWAMSVFTHLTDDWAGWLLELHRVLTPGGYLIATFMGGSMSETLLQEPWEEDRVGMNVIGSGRSWDEGGPWVFHSEWWLRAHWGRAFEIVKVQLAEGSPAAHGLIVLRKKPDTPTVAELKRPESNDPRELSACAHNVEQLHVEDLRLRQLQLTTARRAAALEAQLASNWASKAGRVKGRIRSLIR